MPTPESIVDLIEYPESGDVSLEELSAPGLQITIGPEFGDADPQPLGAAAPGVAVESAREDHVHAHGELGGGALHAAATTNAAGFMPSADRAALAGATSAANANALVRRGSGGEAAFVNLTIGRATQAAATEVVRGDDPRLLQDPSTYLDRANHTGEQAIGTVTGLQDALDDKADLVGGVIPTAQIPSIAITEFLGEVADEAALLALSGGPGDWAARTDTGTTWILVTTGGDELADWRELAYPTGAVQSVNGQVGAVVLAAGDVGAIPASDAGDFATSAEGALAASAVQPTLVVGAGTGLEGGGQLSGDITLSLSSATLDSLGKADTAVQPTRLVSAGTGLEGGGDLSGDITLSLDSASIANLAKADTAVQPTRLVSAGTGLEGGGNLAGNITLSLNSASIASLDKADTAVQLVNGKIPGSLLPTLAVSEYLGEVADEAGMLALLGENGDWCTRTDTGSRWTLITSGGDDINDWIEQAFPDSPVQSVNGEIGAVVLDAVDVGAIPAADISSLATAVQGAKADTAVQPARLVSAGTGLEGGGDLSGDITLSLSSASIASLGKADTAVQPADLTPYAPLDSPALTGTPTAPTQTEADNSTNIATTAFVKNNLVGVAPLASPSFDGTPTAPTATLGTNSTQIATTAFVDATLDVASADFGAALADYAPLDSPALTGTPTAPTQTEADNSTNIATTAFVKAQDYAPLESPVLTGIPTAPTQAGGTRDDRIATTRFVDNLHFVSAFGVGSYTLARKMSGGLQPAGTEIPGSELRPIRLLFNNDDNFAEDTAALTGTWRVMGWDTSLNTANLFRRES